MVVADGLRVRSTASLAGNVTDRLDAGRGSPVRWAGLPRLVGHRRIDRSAHPRAEGLLRGDDPRSSSVHQLPRRSRAAPNLSLIPVQVDSIEGLIKLHRGPLRPRPCRSGAGSPVCPATKSQGSSTASGSSTSPSRRRWSARGGRPGDAAWPDRLRRGRVQRVRGGPLAGRSPRISSTWRISSGTSSASSSSWCPRSRSPTTSICRLRSAARRGLCSLRMGELTRAQAADKAGVEVGIRRPADRARDHRARRRRSAHHRRCPADPDGHDVCRARALVSKPWLPAWRAAGSRYGSWTRPRTSASPR